jgi:hypothetical protein
MAVLETPGGPQGAEESRARGQREPRGRCRHTATSHAFERALCKRRSSQVKPESPSVPLIGQASSRMGRMFGSWQPRVSQRRRTAAGVHARAAGAAAALARLRRGAAAGAHGAKAAVQAGRLPQAALLNFDLTELTSESRRARPSELISQPATTPSAKAPATVAAAFVSADAYAIVVALPAWRAWA